MKEQEHMRKGPSPAAHKIDFSRYRRESEESSRRMREIREDAERHLAEAKRLRDSLKR
jgi:hypothetical protein